MNNDLQVFGNDANYADIAKMMGARVTDTLLPQLKINRDTEDSQGNEIPTGTFFVSQNDNAVYSKTATFRTFINSYRYMTFKADEKKYFKSLIIKNFNEEALDEFGTVRCGKAWKKDLEYLTEAEKKKQEDIKCYRLMFGTVSFPDSDVQDLPCVWQSSGDNFNSAKTALDSMDRMKHLYPQHPINMYLARKKVGSNVYYQAQCDLDVKVTIPFAEADLETFKVFQEHIDRDNRYVAAKWREAIKAQTKESDKELLAKLDLNDEIPF